MVQREGPAFLTLLPGSPCPCLLGQRGRPFGIPDLMDYSAYNPLLLEIQAGDTGCRSRKPSGASRVRHLVLGSQDQGLPGLILLLVKGYFMGCTQEMSRCKFLNKKPTDICNTLTEKQTWDIGLAKRNALNRPAGLYSGASHYDVNSFQRNRCRTKTS